jgi:hypothetical protein
VPATRWFAFNGSEQSEIVSTFDHMFDERWEFVRDALPARRAKHRQLARADEVIE